MTIDTIRKQVGARIKVSQTTIHGWPAMIFSLPFLGAGLYVVGASLGFVPCDDAKFNVSRSLVVCFGGLFVLAGLYLFLHGLISLNQMLRSRGLERMYPNEKWRSDYRWDPRGINDQGLVSFIQGVVSTCGVVIFLTPSNILVFSIKDVSGFAKGIILIFDAIILAFFIGCIYQMLRCLKYKTSRLQFHQFPFFLGDKMEVKLISQTPIKHAKTMTATLRCVEEQYEMRGHGKNRHQEVVTYQLYAETKILSEIQSYGPGAQYISLLFSLPENPALETRLRKRPAVYWELEIKAATPGIDYAANFLAPVYKRS